MRTAIANIAGLSVSLISAVICTLVCFSIKTAFAADDNTQLTADQAGAISQHCASIKQSLRTLQRTDARTRAYLGSAYERALSDYITPLDLRLINVNQPNATLTSLHSSIIDKRKDFNRSYTSYSQSLEELIAIDCQNDPNAFYKQLEDTRKQRAALEKSTSRLRSLLSEHLKAVRNLKDTLASEAEKGSDDASN